MTNKLKDWSTTAASNNSTPPEGWPEGMAPSKVNDTARQNMAYIREWYEDSEWIRYAHTISASDASSVTISGDVTGVYVADRAVRLDQDSAKIGYVSSSSYSAPNTTVNISGITVSSPTIIEVGAIKNEESLPNDVVGSKSRNLIGYPPGFLYGLRISSAADADHDITVATGNCRAAGDDANINLTSAITKQLDAAWAEGNNAGGLPSGVTLSGPEWLYFFVISKADGTVDAGFDDNASATNLLAAASGYSYYRQVGGVLTNSSDNVLGMFSVADLGTGRDSILIESSMTLPAAPGASVYKNVLIVGAGGGGRSAVDGGDGGSTSIDAVYTAGGGSGSAPGTGGSASASGYDVSRIVWIHAGKDGQVGAGDGVSGYGGEAGFVDVADWPRITGGTLGASGDGTYGGGGGGANSNYSGGGGGAAIYLRDYPATSSLTVTIGAGGVSGNGAAGDGGDGFVKLEF